jgi:hypothetical protein
MAQNEGVLKFNLRGSLHGGLAAFMGWPSRLPYHRTRDEKFRTEAAETDLTIPTGALSAGNS